MGYRAEGVRGAWSGREGCHNCFVLPAPNAPCWPYHLACTLSPPCTRHCSCPRLKNAARTTPQVEESALQALTFVSHRYWGFPHNFLALLFGAWLPALQLVCACCDCDWDMQPPCSSASVLLCVQSNSKQSCAPCNAIRHAANDFPTPLPPLLFAVAEEWRYEPRGMEGQKLVWVDCEELMSYADK